VDTALRERRDPLTDEEQPGASCSLVAGGAVVGAATVWLLLRAALDRGASAQLLRL